MRVKLILLALFASLFLVSCDPKPPGECPTGWTAMSSQGWWQDDGPDGLTRVPQELSDENVGGHLHIDLCAPLNLRVDGDTLELNVKIKTHQRFTGVGDRLDVGLAPGGSTVVDVPAPDVSIGSTACPGDPNDPHVMCTTPVSVTVPIGDIPAGPQSLRIRYLSAEHPNGERQFTSNEVRFFNRSDPTGCLEQEGKGWFEGTDYARAGIKSCIPTGDVSGTWTFNQSARSTNDPITAMQTYVDARFGHDEFSNLVQTYTPPASSGSVTRSVSIDTTQFTNGWHCVALVTQVQVDGNVNTGVLEFPIKVNNENPGTIGPGKGSCYV